MQVTTETVRDLTPHALAVALAKASPKDFAAFWFAFAEACSPESLDQFARAMAPTLGGIRQRPLRELCRLMDFHEVLAERKEGS